MKRSEALGKIVLEGKTDGKRERESRRRRWEKDIQDGFDMSLTEAGRLANDRNCFRCAVKDVTSYGIRS